VSGTEQNPLDMSDDEFLQTAQPPAPDEGAGENGASIESEEKDKADADKTDTGAEDTSGDADATGSDGEGDADDKQSGDDVDANSDKSGGETGDDEEADKKAEGDGKAEPEKKADEKAAEPVKKDEEKKDVPAGSEDEASEKPGTEKVFQVPTSFKANGKTIELKSEKEALALMQMGANYTKKLQELQPHKKMLMMLENNGLLDEGKLTYLIDLDKKNPEAIKKLIRDAGIDPLEIDINADPAYKPGNHSVSDEQVQFRTVINELADHAAGKETILQVQSWDQASKDAVWKQPEIMRVIHEQRENGIYDIINAEVERRKTLGTLPATTPFLEAYKTVGDEMAAATLANETGNKGDGTTGSQEKPEKTVVATRKADPKEAVKNGDKAAAAAPTKATSGSAREVKNPLAMSDEDFLKSMENRL
jgi:hypothetical protein